MLLLAFYRKNIIYEYFVHLIKIHTFVNHLMI